MLLVISIKLIDAESVRLALLKSFDILALYKFDYYYYYYVTNHLGQLSQAILLWAGE